MIKFCVLGSGSKGNSVFVEINGYKMLLDAGFTYKKMVRKLAGINKSPRDIQSIFWTHKHNDHVAGCKMIEKKHGAMIFGPGFLRHDGDLFCDSNKVVVTAFNLSHDEPCLGYIVKDLVNNLKLAYITDTGTIPCESLEYLIDCNAIIIETNHDIDMLTGDRNPYTTELKERIFETHLRNEQARDLISLLKWDGLQYVVGYHLSENSNSPAIARHELESVLRDGKTEVVIAEQNTPTKLMVIM